MQVSPFYNVIAKSAPAGLYPGRSSSTAEIASYPRPRTVAHAAPRLARIRRRHALGLGGLAEVEAFENSLTMGPLQPRASIPPLIERDDSWT
jgi:hypothetical protein